MYKGFILNFGDKNLAAASLKFIIFIVEFVIKNNIIIPHPSHLPDLAP
jgi:hypothetical protein